MVGGRISLSETSLVLVKSSMEFKVLGEPIVKNGGEKFSKARQYRNRAVIFWIKVTTFIFVYGSYFSF